MTKLDRIEQAVSKYYGKKVVIHCVYDLGDYYVVLGLPKGISPSTVSDGYSKVTKNDYEVSGFSPNMDLKRFVDAIKKPLYAIE